MAGSSPRTAGRVVFRPSLGVALYGPSDPSCFLPRATIRNASPSSGLWSARASFAGAVSHCSTSSRLVRITGMALGWIGATTAFGSVVRKAKISFLVSPSLALRMGFPARPYRRKESVRLAFFVGQPHGRPRLVGHDFVLGKRRERDNGDRLSSVGRVASRPRAGVLALGDRCGASLEGLDIFATTKSRTAVKRVSRLPYAYREDFRGPEDNPYQRKSLISLVPVA
jgi:hypothetical protein